VRWAAIEAVARYRGRPTISPTYQRIARRHGRNIGRVAAARKLLTLVYYGLRDGEIRVLAQATGGFGHSHGASTANDVSPPPMRWTRPR
jgi:hypothetical protein